MSRESASSATDPARRPETSSTTNIMAFATNTRRRVVAWRSRSRSTALALSMQQSSIVSITPNVGLHRQEKAGKILLATVRCRAWLGVKFVIRV